MNSMKCVVKILESTGVKWESLGDISTLKRGRVMSRGYLDDNAGDYPVYSSQTVNNGMIGRINTFDFDGEYISWTTDGANAGTVFYRTGKFSITNVCGSIKINDESRLNYKFLFYWLSIEAKKHVYSGMGNPKLMSHQVEKIPVPIPCPDNPKKSLVIQAEIVRILDAFTKLTTKLTTELTTELSLRKKQYNYYRDQLLSFEEGEVEWKTLGEVGKIRRGTAITKKQTNPGNYPVIANGPSHNYFHDQSNRSGETIVIARSGAYAGLVSYWDIPFFLTDAFSIHPDNDRLSTKFLYYVLKKDQTQIHNMGAGAGVPHVRAKDFESYKVPIPSTEEQNRIVSILDKFDTLTTSIQDGLPREIELRQKQYKYYRDLLLSFPKLDAEVAA